MKTTTSILERIVKFIGGRHERWSSLARGLGTRPSESSGVLAGEIIAASYHDGSLTVTLAAEDAPGN